MARRKGSAGKDPMRIWYECRNLESRVLYGAVPYRVVGVGWHRFCYSAMVSVVPVPGRHISNVVTRTMHVFLFAHRIIEARSQRRNRRQQFWTSIKGVEQGDIETYPRMPRRPPQSYASPERLRSSIPTYYQ